MITRFITLMLIAVLALPVATLTRPAESSHSPWGEVAVAAKGKQHKKKHKQQANEPQFTTVTRTVRQPVTRIFTNTQPITIPNGAPGQFNFPASPYPAAITVRGLANGAITDVNVILTDLTNSYPEDVNVLLSTSDGRRAFVLSGVGGAVGVTDIDLVLDDEAAAALPFGPGSQLGSGTFQPTATSYGATSMPAPAPALDGSVALSAFDGADPNGTWQLWVITSGGAPGDLAGWALEITAEVDAGQVEEQVPLPVAKDKKKKKGKGRR